MPPCFAALFLLVLGIGLIGRPPTSDYWAEFGINRVIKIKNYVIALLNIRAGVVIYVPINPLILQADYIIWITDVGVTKAAFFAPGAYTIIPIGHGVQSYFHMSHAWIRYGYNARHPCVLLQLNYSIDKYFFHTLNIKRHFSCANGYSVKKIWRYYNYKSNILLYFVGVC